MLNFKNKKSGFTLLEVLLVIAVLAIIAAASTGFFRGFVRMSSLEGTAKVIISDLTNARAKAMAGESGMKWGIHFANGASDYYELFSTPSDYSSPSKTVVETKYLPGGVIFINPIDAIFSRITGSLPSILTVTISLDSETRAITIMPIGNIY